MLSLYGERFFVVLQAHYLTSTPSGLLLLQRGRAGRGSGCLRVRQVRAQVPQERPPLRAAPPSIALRGKHPQGYPSFPRSVPHTLRLAFPYMTETFPISSIRLSIPITCLCRREHIGVGTNGSHHLPHRPTSSSTGSWPSRQKALAREEPPPHLIP